MSVSSSNNWSACFSAAAAVSVDWPYVLNSLPVWQYLYSALKSCKGYGGAGGFRLRLSEQVCFEVFFKGV